MPVTSIDVDPEALTITVTADFTAPVRRLWEAHLDPRQIERFWGPPTFPAQFTRHDGFVGGTSKYCMTGPAGEKSCGYWEWTAIDEGRSFEVLDGFANEDGEPNPDMPSMRLIFEFTETASGSRLTSTSHMNSLEELEQLQEMGVMEGTSAAMQQIDDVLADDGSFAAEKGTVVQLIGDHQARVSRIVRGSVEQVWRAHVDPELLKLWQLGPDGWSMPVCEMSATPGDETRSEWQNDATGERFGFSGVVVEASEPCRLVTTERMVGPDDQDGSATVQALNELTLTAVGNDTLLCYLITYPDTDTRDAALATGMADGMEAGYERLEREILA